MASDNVFERQSAVMAGIIERRAKFFDEFMGVGQRPPFTKKLSVKDKASFFNALPPDKQVELWAQMDGAERAQVLGLDK